MGKWERIEVDQVIRCACHESAQGNCETRVDILPSKQYGEKMYMMDGEHAFSIILPKDVALCRLVDAEPAAGERGWRDFYNEVMRRAEQEDDATVYADRIAYHLDIVAEEWGKEGESNE